MTNHMLGACIVSAMSLILPCEALAAATNDALPNSETILSLAKEIEFAKEPVIGGPVVRRYAPNFRMQVFFHTKMLDIPHDGGAIAGKIILQGIPPSYGVPDGTYYLWMGRVDGQLKAALANMDGSVQTELCARELPPGAKPESHTLRPSMGPTPCDRIKVAAPLPGTLPPGATRPPPPPPAAKTPPKPPPTQRRTLQDICYTENGNKPPVTKYRKGVVYVPDS